MLDIQSLDFQKNPTQQLLTRVLDATALRHKVLAQNVANSDTPGYVRSDVPFEGELAEAIKSGNLSSFSPQVVEDRSAPARGDGNNVSIERELSELNKNYLLHQLAIQFMQTKLSMHRSAITGRSM